MQPLKKENLGLNKSALSPVSFLTFKSLQDYSVIYQKMRSFTLARDSNTPDEIWLLEHHPVFTQGQAGKAEHIVNPNHMGHIPVVQSDRGGQITYHGPGQIMVYCLIDLIRRDMNIRDCVNLLENLVIRLLQQYGITGATKAGAPGVYVADAKIASIGLRVRKGRSYHGLCLNVDSDLSPFLGINPCGYQGLQMTQIKDHVPHLSIGTVYNDLQIILQGVL